MYSEINQYNDEEDIEFYSHPELPNMLLWDAEVIDFVINRLFNLHWDLDQEEPGDVVAAGLLAGVCCLREEGASAEDRVRGFFNGIWVAADWMVNAHAEDWLNRAGAENGRWPGREVARQLWDATCSFGNDGFTFGRRISGEDKNIIQEPKGGSYELDVMRRVLGASAGHPAHQHLAAALALLEEQPLERHRPLKSE
ncbi:TPA: hypothetical protein SL633_001098 [Pseudomonas aeruginosa]|nr:hypothetical protein [Pseudomonas aeruginosa]HEJ4931955.1 hypothetical protein [Pseudomonas aeruginosa]